MVMVMIKFFFRTLFQAGILLALLTIVAFISFTNPVFAEYVRPTEPDGPPHTHKLTNFPHAKYAGSHAESSTKILIVTGGDGPLTGVSPIEEKDFWLDVLSEMPEIPSFDVDFIVDWYDGIPTFELLNGYDLVIYDAGGYWYPLRDVTEPLRQYHFSGRPLIVVTPDINWDWKQSGEPVPSFCNDVLHIEGVLGIMDTASYDLYANTGWEIILTPIGVPALSSWPDCFDPKEDAIGTIIQGDIPETEFGVGTCSGLPSCSLYDPEGQLHASVIYPGSTDEGLAITYGFPISGLESSVIAKKLAKSSIIWALQKNKVTIHGFTKDISENNIGGVTVKLYNPIEYLLGLPPIASTTSDPSGWYEFSGLTPGNYKLVAYKVGYYGAQTISKYYDNGTYNEDLVLLTSECGFIIGLMESLKCSILGVGSQYSEWMSEMTCTVDETAEEPYEDLLGLLVGVVSPGGDDLYTAYLSNLATTGGTFAWATGCSMIAKIELGEMSQESNEDVRIIIEPYIFDSDNAHDMAVSQLEDLDTYKYFESNLNSLHDDFTVNVPPIHPDFCLLECSRAVVGAIGQCADIKNGERKYFIPLDASGDIQAQDFYSAYWAYRTQKAMLGILGNISDFCTGVQIGADIAIVGGAAASVTGAGAVPGGAVIAAGITANTIAGAIGSVTAVVKAPLDAEFQRHYGYSAIQWTHTLNNLPEIYDSTSNFFIIDEEIQNPKYLNKNNSYDAEVNIDLNPDFTFLGNHYLFTSMDYLGLMSDIHTAHVSANNLGDNSRLRITAEATWTPTLENLIAEFLGYPKLKFPGGAGIATSNKEVSSLSCNVKYWGYYHNAVDLFTSHLFKAEVYTGPFNKANDLIDYYVVPLPIGGLPQQSHVTTKSYTEAKLPARTKASRLTANTFAKMAAGNTEKHKIRLSASDTEFSQNYSASENTFALRVTLLHPAGIDVNLHTYDPSGAHVGFNKNTGMIENGFIATYTGNRTNPETILIPNATNKSYTIKATLESTSSNMEEPVVVNITEIPIREAVLAFAPGCISETPEPGNELTITSNIGEAGGQKDLEEVDVTMGTLSNNEGSTLIPASQASYTADTIPAGTSNNYTFTFDTPNDAQGQYTGHISISSSNAGTLQQEVFVTIMFDGDANGDGTINVQDVIGIINHILGTGTASGSPDCNNDGSINVQDVICVINKILGG